MCLAECGSRSFWPVQSNGTWKELTQCTWSPSRLKHLFQFFSEKSPIVPIFIEREQIIYQMAMRIRLLTDFLKWFPSLQRLHIWPLHNISYDICLVHSSTSGKHTYNSWANKWQSQTLSCCCVEQHNVNNGKFKSDIMSSISAKQKQPLFHIMYVTLTSLKIRISTYGFGQFTAHMQHTS